MTDTAETTTGMLPDVEKYFNAINEASDVYNSARRDSEIGSAGRRTAYDDYHSARVAAWKALETSEVPLLAWIAMNAEDERSNAELLMRDLRPDFTIADMDRIARVHGWCGVWKNEWRRRILDAGVVAAPVYQIQVREPGDEGWRPVRDYGLPIGITKELLDRLFDSGVAFLALDTTNGGNYKFQLDPIQPQPTGRYVDDD